MREGDFVLGSDWVPQDDFVDVIELVPVLIEISEISIERLEPRSSRNSNVEGLGSEEGLQIEKIEVVLVDNV